MSENHAIAIIADNRTGILRDVGAVFAELNANINFIQQDVVKKDGESFAWMDFEVEYDGELSELTDRLKKISGIREASVHSTAREIFGKRVIVIGGGAQVAQVALGAVNEADRHNIRGERISVDTIPLVGEESLAKAVDAVSRLPRVSILVLAGSIMGGDITDAIKRVKAAGIPVICLNMAGSASSAADLVVTDPIQAGVMAVMHISTIGVFNLKRVAGKEF